MTTAALGTLALDDDEATMLFDLVVGLTYSQVHDATGRRQEDIAAFESLSERFGRAAVVLWMVEAAELIPHSWLVELLRDYEAETAREVDGEIAKQITGYGAVFRAARFG
jgi:hypothetical protein